MGILACSIASISRFIQRMVIVSVLGCAAATISRVKVMTMIAPLSAFVAGLAASISRVKVLVMITLFSTLVAGFAAAQFVGIVV